MQGTTSLITTRSQVRILPGSLFHYGPVAQWVEQECFTVLLSPWLLKTLGGMLFVITFDYESKYARSQAILVPRPNLDRKVNLPGCRHCLLNSWNRCLCLWIVPTAFRQNLCLGRLGMSEPNGL